VEKPNDFITVIANAAEKPPVQAMPVIYYPVTGISGLHGEDKLARYKVPEAERFYNCFCQQCGSPMPRTVPELDAVLIPAGSLDSQPPVNPKSISRGIFFGTHMQTGRVKTACQYLLSTPQNPEDTI